MWLKEGDYLFESGSYGHAVTLYIHGIEGLLHAYYSWLVFISAISISNREFIDVFKHHKPKLRSCYGFILGSILFNAVRSSPDRKMKANEIEKAIGADIKILNHESASFAKTILEARNRGIYSQFHDDPPRFQFPSEVSMKEADAIKTLVLSVHKVVSGYIRNEDKSINKIIKNYYDGFKVENSS